MKSIWYCSSLQQDKFSNNTRSNFTNNFDVDDLNGIADGEIEVAIKNIYFDEENIEENSKHSLIRNRPRVYGDKVLSIRSNICFSSIVNSQYEKELCQFKVDRDHHFEFVNPTYYTTSKELLANATFSIIDVKLRDTPDWKIGSPTYIQAIVRSKMADSFSIYLESNDKDSVNSKTNTNMNFTIDLPQRLQLDGWDVCLKSIILPCRIWNIYDDDDYGFGWTHSSGPSMEKSAGTFYDTQPGCYEVEDIVYLMDKRLTRGWLKMTYKEDINRIVLDKTQNFSPRHTQYLKFFPYTAKILGFTKDVEDKGFDVTIRGHRGQQPVIAKHPPNINFFSPKTIIVACNIVEDTIFGGERVKLLKVILNRMETNGDVIQYEFLQDEYVKLGINEFDRIKISICDVSGDNLKVDYKEIPTRLQLEFRKPRSLKEPQHKEY